MGGRPPPQWGALCSTLSRLGLDDLSLEALRPEHLSSEALLGGASQRPLAKTLEESLIPSPPAPQKKKSGYDLKHYF